MVFVITYDMGTTNCKACLYSIEDSIRLIQSEMGEYPLITLENHGAEQRVEDWWRAICTGTRNLIQKSKVSVHDIKAIAFCCQMQASILVDKNGNALRNPMIWLDARSAEIADRIVHRGFPKISGYNIPNLIISLKYTGAGAGSAKDPVFKYLWVKEHEPTLFQQTYKWLDVKDYLNLRCTGKIKQTYDSANLTWAYDTRPGHLQWCEPLCKIYGINMEHLPEVIRSTDIVGNLTETAANEMGLKEGIPVFGGGGDASLIPIGAGCVDEFDTHIYTGTSGWVVSNVKKRMVSISNFIGPVMNAIPGFYSFTAEQETSGICLQWVRDHLAMDEIGVYLNQQGKSDLNTQVDTLYDYMNNVVLQTPPGAGNVIFTPWLHGNRSPKEDPYVRGSFFNIGLQTGKRQLIRAVLEGVSYHTRWMLEAMEKKIPHQSMLRFAGGGAKSEVWSQIMADVLNRKIETIESPQNAGTIGAAIVCAIGLGLCKDFPSAKKYIGVKKIFTPREEFQDVYDANYSVFKDLYKGTKKLYKRLNKV